MEEEKLKTIARQLRRPEGELGIQIGQKMNEGNEYINRYTIQALQPEANDNILEIGMGNGFFVSEILSVHPSIQYTGCDFSDVMIKEAERINASAIRRKQAQFFLTQADTLPFNGNTFNKLITINTIYFWQDRQAIFNEIRRVLKPGGQLIIAVRPQSTMEDLPFVKYGFQMFTKEALTALVAQHKFRVTDIYEKEEPAQEVDGRKIRMESLIVCAVK